MFELLKTMSKALCLLAFSGQLCLQVSAAELVVRPLVIGETLELASAQMQEQRRVNVWLPDAYQQQKTTAFPVVFMLDGGAAEDFIHIAGLMQVSIANGSMRPFILVGIENTVRRRDLTGTSENALDKRDIPNLGGSAQFRRFIADELIPTISQRYRTTNERALVGESLAGLFVVETLVEKPDLFQSYVAIDPSLWWNDRRLTQAFSEQLKTQSRLDKRLYFASSSAPGMEPAIKPLAEVLTQQKPQGLVWTYDHFSNENHATIFHPAALKAFRLVFAPEAKEHAK
ncbi:MAG: alpha/beta hydrolase [Burkholderiales bacterium]|nr:alpha/beta hydrolase [Burkholderiales bacterium]